MWFLAEIYVLVLGFSVYHFNPIEGVCQGTPWNCQITNMCEIQSFPFNSLVRTRFACQLTRQFVFNCRKPFSSSLTTISELGVTMFSICGCVWVFLNSPRQSYPFLNPVRKISRVICIWTYNRYWYTHTHTHTYIYIYIYIYMHVRQYNFFSSNIPGRGRFARQ